MDEKKSQLTPVRPNQISAKSGQPRSNCPALAFRLAEICTGRAAGSGQGPGAMGEMAWQHLGHCARVSLPLGLGLLHWCAYTPSMDEQLSAARALLDWLASHPDARALGAYVHPGLAVARDQWGGLSLRVKRTDEVCSALANHVAALGLRRWMGLTPDELVFAIPRELTIAAASSTAQRPVTTGGAASSLDEPPAQPSQTEPYTALAREFAALVAAQQASSRDGAQRPTHTLPRALLSAYLGCLPTPQDLERLLPVLWALQPCLTQTQPQSEADSQAADADAGISDTVKRARWLLGVASVSQALHTALKQQLTLLLQYLPPARRAALEFVLSAAAADASLHEAPQLTPQAPPAHHQQQQQEGAESSSSVPSPASARQLCWAQGLVWSRAIQLWSGPTFVPLADLLNHNHPPNVMCRGATQGEEDEGTACQGGEGGEGPVRKGVQTFECYAVQLLPPGAELHWVYCSHPHDTGMCGQLPCTHTHTCTCTHVALMWLAYTDICRVL